MATIELTIETGFVLSGGKDLKEADCWRGVDDDAEADLPPHVILILWEQIEVQKALV